MTKTTDYEKYLKSQGYKKGRFSFGEPDEPIFDGWHFPHERWNGFACPFFTAEVKKQILDFYNRREMFDGDEEFQDPEQNDWIEIAENKEPNWAGLYGMGYGLTWFEENSND